jgi:hypothetical protein
VTVEPNDLATQLGVSAKSLRAWLRRTYPRSSVDHSTRWNLTETQLAAASAHFGASRRSAPPPSRGAMAAPRVGRTRDASDEAYVIDLCNEILGERARRQHCFDWLLGDPGTSGGRLRLPVDAYYRDHGLIVEYQERQHDEPVAHFDKPDRMTASGVHRGEQRKLYDRRRGSRYLLTVCASSSSAPVTFRATRADDYVATVSRTSGRFDASSGSRTDVVEVAPRDQTCNRSTATEQLSLWSVAPERSYILCASTATLSGNRGSSRSSTPVGTSSMTSPRRKPTHERRFPLACTVKRLLSTAE